MVDPTLYSDDKEKLKHSGFGIASFVISIVTVFMIWGCLIYGVYLEEAMPQLSEDAPIILALAYSAILGSILCVFGTILGICSIFHKNRRRIFTVLGLCINLTSIVFIILIFS